MKKTCLLFDNDGTLVDSEYLCNLGIAQQFALLDVELNVEELIRCYRGGKMSQVLDAIASRHQVSLPDSFLPEYRRRIAALFDAHLKPVEGIPSVLKQLPQTKAVVSNGPREKIEHALSLCKLTGFFDDNIYSAYDVGVYKPDPQLYLHVAKKLGVSPQQCVVVEDSLPGVTAGSRAGMTTLFYNVHQEQTNLPHVISFDDMYRLPQLIEALS